MRIIIVDVNTNNKHDAAREKGWAYFAGWCTSSSLKAMEGVLYRIGDKEFWARWITYTPDTTVSDANELINGKLVTYIYQSSRIDINGTGVARKYTDTAKSKRKFGIKHIILVRSIILYMIMVQILYYKIFKHIKKHLNIVDRTNVL